MREAGVALEAACEPTRAWSEAYAIVLARVRATDPHVVEAERLFESARGRLGQLASWPVIDEEADWLNECIRYVERLLRAPAFGALFLGLSEDAAGRERSRRADDECRA